MTLLCVENRSLTLRNNVSRTNILFHVYIRIIRMRTRHLCHRDPRHGIPQGVLRNAASVHSTLYVPLTPLRLVSTLGTGCTCTGAVYYGLLLLSPSIRVIGQSASSAECVANGR